MHWMACPVPLTLNEQALFNFSSGPAIVSPSLFHSETQGSSQMTKKTTWKAQVNDKNRFFDHSRN